ncbi:proton-conducting transporter membrane subunit [Holophaga foetida]|uniref:proton-conducting transporter transmembrane domain-containing protein n=1 Tax=Holophaga foetida TaxID=35839 RepID=UPI00024749A4|nr:proton-conducting transporter membrane subunit [Holophaga foetida]
MIPYGLALLLVALSGIPGLFLQKGGGRIAAILQGLGALAGLTASLHLLCGGRPWTLSLPATPLGSAGLLHFDAIAAFFLIPVLLVPACGSLFGVGYWRDRDENASRLHLLYGLLTAFLALLVAASHAFTFLLGWEGMAMAAFFLVITEDRNPETRRAGWIYLVSTHTGTLCLLGAFALVSAATGSFAFSAFPAGLAGTGRLTAAFVLFLLGFGFKMGAFPLHFWLPPAHAAAPSHVSAFMSGVLIKMGVLGLVRFLAWVPDPPLWWGGVLVILGALSGILGVAFALGQHSLKRLLAYHSIENIGIILLGIGIGSIGKSTGHLEIMVLGYGGGLLHVLNHSLFKGLLFLAAGSVVHATGTQNLEELGGLARSMPRTSAGFLTGAWAICGLPPLNGFISEWLIYLAAFRGLILTRSPWPILTLTALAIIGALALACFCKAFGIVFLGEPRSEHATHAHESPRTMLVPMGILGGACILIGLFSFLGLPGLDRLVADLAGQQVLPGIGELAHLPALSVLAIPLLGLACLLWRWARAMPSARQVPTWDCGYAAATPRMQYTASSLADGLVSGMRIVLLPKVRWRRILAIFPSPRRFHSHLPDPVLDRVASPGLDLLSRFLILFRILQRGYLAVYLLYVMLTLIFLLVWMVV